MTRHPALRSASLAIAALTVGVLAIASCGAAGVPGSTPSGSAAPDPEPTGVLPPTSVPAAGEVMTETDVIQAVDGLPRLCLAGVRESYPPSCSGPEVRNWDWDGVELSDTADGVTWGTYAVQGTWDGVAFTLTKPATPYSYPDSNPNADPRMDPANPGTNDEAALEAIAVAIRQSGQPVHHLTAINGYLTVGVSYDDGTLQDRYDNEYGPDTVIVQSGLRPVP